MSDTPFKPGDRVRLLEPWLTTGGVVIYEAGAKATVLDERPFVVDNVTVRIDGDAWDEIWDMPYKILERINGLDQMLELLP